MRTNGFTPKRGRAPTKRKASRKKGRTKKLSKSYITRSGRGGIKN